MMKQELTKKRSVFIKREVLEEWLSDMAAEGWMPVEFTYIFFDSFLFFRFQKQAAKKLRFCIYDSKLEGDNDVFASFGWKQQLECESTVVYTHEDLDAELPLLDMRMYSLRRFIKSICNLSFLVVLLFAIRMEDTYVRPRLVFYSSLFLLSLPRMYDVKSTKRGSNLTKLLKNIGLALLAAICVTILIEVGMHAKASFG